MANITPFGLRLRPELKKRVEEAARANGRSLNAEITARLEASLRGDYGVPDFVSGNRMDALGAELETVQAKVRALTAIVNEMQRNKSQVTGG